MAWIRGYREECFCIRYRACMLMKWPGGTYFFFWNNSQDNLHVAYNSCLPKIHVAVFALSMHFLGPLGTGWEITH